MQAKAKAEQKTGNNDLNLFSHIIKSLYAIQVKMWVFIKGNEAARSVPQGPRR